MQKIQNAQNTARQRHGPRLMSALLTTDYLAAEALTICKAAGKADYTVGVTDTRLPDGSHAYYLTVHTFLGAEKTIYKDNAEQLLAGLAEYVGCQWPIANITADQKQELIRLGNHQYTTRPEKTELLLNMHQLTEQQAKAKIDAFRLVLDGRYPKHYAVVASAELVQANGHKEYERITDRCDCESDGCQFCLRLVSAA